MVYIIQLCVVELKCTALFNEIINFIFCSVPYQDPRRVGNTIRQELNRRENISFAFIVLANNNVTTYAEVKKICVLDFASKL